MKYKIFETDKFTEKWEIAYEKVKYSLEQSQVKQKKIDRHKQPCSFA